MSECPADPLLEEFLLEQLPDGEFEHMARHVDQCPSCQARLETIVSCDETDRWRHLRQEQSPEETKTDDESYFSSSAIRAAKDGKQLLIPGHDILGVLGRGGMGIVYKARHRRLQRVVAVKMIDSIGPVAREAGVRFLAEARSVARLQHANILHVYEIGDHQGHPYFSMEYLQGGSLADRTQEGPLPPREAAELTMTLAGALHFAHEAGIVHRDVKPANVLLTTQGVPKVADFGLAKELEADSGYTRTGSILGSPSYMASEQANGRIDLVDARTDVYSLGAILYEMLTGRPPFRGASVVETLDQVRHQEPVRVRQLRSNVPRDLETICLKCLEKQPRKRYDSAEALADDLQRFLAGHVIAARPAGPIERFSKWARRRPAAAIALAATLTLFMTLCGGSLAYSIQVADYNRQLSTSKDELQRRSDDLNRVNGELLGAIDSANANAQAATVAKDEAEQARDAARLQTALRDRDRGLELCHDGDVNLGLLYLVRSLKIAPGDSEPFRHSVLMNLSAWSRHAVSPLPLGIEGTEISLSSDFRKLLSGDLREARMPDGSRPLRPNMRLVDMSPAEKGRSVRLRRGASFLGSVFLDQRRQNRGGFNSNGRLLATPWDRCAIVWDADTGREKASLPHPDSKLVSTMFHPSQPILLTCCEEGTVRFWNVETSEQMDITLDHPQRIDLATFVNDGEEVVTFGGGVVKRWEAKTGKEIGSFRILGAWVATASSDGKTLLIADQERQVNCWDLASGQPRGLPLFHGNRVRSMAFDSTNTSVLTGGGDCQARLWDLKSATEISPPMRHLRHLKRVAFGPKNWVFTSDGTVRAWQLGAKDDLDGLVTREPTRLVRFSLDGQNILGGAHDGVFVWDTATRRQLFGSRTSSPTASIAFSPDGTQAVVQHVSGRRMSLLDLQTKQVTVLPSAIRTRLITAEFSQDGRRVVVADSSGLAEVFDVATKTLLGKPLNHGKRIGSLKFNADGSTIWTCSYDGTKRWEVATGNQLGPPLPAILLATTPDHRFALMSWRDNAGTFAGPANLVDINTGKATGDQFGFKDQEVGRAVFSRDGAALLTTSGSKVYLWNVSTTELLMERPLVSLAFPTTAEFTTNGESFLLGDSVGHVGLWDVRTGVLLGPKLSHGKRVDSVATSPDGRWQVSAGTEGIRVRRLPQPVPDQPAELERALEALTGLALDEFGQPRVLSDEELEQHRSSANNELLPRRWAEWPMIE